MVTPKNSVTTLPPFKNIMLPPEKDLVGYISLMTPGQLEQLVRVAELIVTGPDLSRATPLHSLTGEDNLQADCFQWHNRHFRRVSLLFAVPNGGTRNPIEAKKLQATGTRAGISDLILVAREGVYFIEMKIGKEDTKPEQKLIQAILEYLGYKYYVCRTKGEFRQLILTLLANYLIPGKIYT